MTPENLRRWKQLSPNMRRLLVSHRRDELETEQDLLSGTMRDLETEFGSRTWPTSAAVVAEGEDEDRRSEDDHACMTLREVGDVLGLSPERTRQIQDGALRKLRQYFLPLLQELFYGERQ